MRESASTDLREPQGSNPLGPPGPELRIRLDDLLRRWEEVRARGESPTPEEICRDAPDLLEPFRGELGALCAADQGLAVASARSPSNAESPETWAGPPGQPEISPHPGAEPVDAFRGHHTELRKNQHHR